MNENTFSGRPHRSAAGFSLMELLTVIIIIGLLASVSYPLLRAYKPNLTARGGARQLETLLNQARLRAASLKKPVRAVINCTRPDGFKSCFLDLQTAVYTNENVTGWSREPKERRVLDSSLTVTKKSASAPHDGQVTVRDIYWVIFLPAGQVYSDPKPLELFVYHGSQKKPAKSGWKIAVASETGRAEMVRDTLKAP
jgi:prepilin-type N-terminal cleavage/methylation domain-containing protein